ncbi:MAG: hypothetical protein IAI50_05445 [Candidatus Eremiobacteraeota bacterium]|nr:hypothetical protein [Candidatus Eremiobacteraeota bacterium]
MVTIGFAVRPRGGGIAYVRVPGRGATGEAFVRVGFACRPLPALLGRDVAYAALTAVAEMLLRRGIRDVELRTDDRTVATDLAERRILPATLTVPYVALRCKLNRFAAATVAPVGADLTRDLVARARAEASLDVAA